MAIQFYAPFPFFLLLLFFNLRSYLMDWYFGSGIDDLVVPKYDQEVSDRLPSPDSWSKWGIRESESFRSPDKCFIMDANLAQQQLNHYGKSMCNEVEMDAFHDKDHSCSSSICEGFSEESFHQRALSRDWPACQLNDLAGFEQMNDVFLYKYNFWDYLDLFYVGN